MSAISVHKVKPAIRHWWLLPLSGLVLVALGIWIFSERLTAYLLICAIFSVGILITGLTELLFVLLTRRASGVVVYALLGAFVDLFTGIYLFYYPLISLIILPVILGFWLMLRGVLAIASAWQLHNNARKGWPWLVLAGSLVLIMSVTLLANLIWGVGDIIIHIGIGFLSAGLFRIYLGFRMRALIPDGHDK